jgi:hypothetical protein
MKTLVEIGISSTYGEGEFARTREILGRRVINSALLIWGEELRVRLWGGGESGDGRSRMRILAVRGTEGGVLQVNTRRAVIESTGLLNRGLQMVLMLILF